VNRLVPEVEINTTVQLDARVRLNFDIKKLDPSFGHQKAPKLYDVSLAFNGETVKDKIGFRSIKVKAAEIFC